MSKLDLKRVRELTKEELLEIHGGGVMKRFGAWCHETWCKIKDTAKELAQLDWSGNPLGFM